MPFVNAAFGRFTAALVLTRLSFDLLIAAGALCDHYWLPLVLLLPAPLLFVMWLYGVHRQSDGVDEAHEREASHTALWCWFVPGFNGAQPVRLVWEVWRALGTEQAPRFAYVLGVWWTLVLVRCPLVALSFLGLPSWVLVAAHTLSGLLTAYVVLETTSWMVARQRQDWAHMTPTAF